MKKSTLLKKTKNELVDKLISLEDKLISLEDKYDSLEIDYRDVCDKFAFCIAENEEYVDEVLHNKRNLKILFVVCVILSILNIIQLFV